MDKLLNGKAKTEFLNWLISTRNEIIKDGNIEYDLYYLTVYLLPESLQYALIIEFFDSVGICILIGRNSIIKKFYFNIDKLVYGTNPVETRLEATKSAIETAVRLFNEKQN